MPIFSEDVEKRQNPVCHFVTPLDGNMDSGVHRPTEVSMSGVSFDCTSFLIYRSEGLKTSTPVVFLEEFA